MPNFAAVCGVSPNCANTGMPARDQRAHRVGKIGGGVDLDHVGAAFLDQAAARRAAAASGSPAPARKARRSSPARASTPRRTALQTTSISSMRDLQRVVVAPQIDADRVADRDEVDAGDDRRSAPSACPRRPRRRSSAVALHLLERRDGDFVGHGFASRAVRGHRYLSPLCLQHGGERLRRIGQRRRHRPAPCARSAGAPRRDRAAR